MAVVRASARHWRAGRRRLPAANAWPSAAPRVARPTPGLAAPRRRLLFLAVDEVARLHESFDRSVHRNFGLQETVLSDRLDDAIVLGYGVLGVMVLYAYRTELAAYREVLPLVTCGVTLFVFMQGLDTVGNRADVFRAVGVPDEGIAILRSWLGGIEEALCGGCVTRKRVHLRIHHRGAPRLDRVPILKPLGPFDKLRDLPILKFVEPAVSSAYGALSLPKGRRIETNPKVASALLLPAVSYSQTETSRALRGRRARFLAGA